MKIKSFTISFILALLTLSASFSGCISQEEKTQESTADSYQSQISELENQTIFYQNQVNNLSTLLLSSNNNVSILSNILLNNSDENQVLNGKLVENITHIEYLNQQIETQLDQIMLLQSEILSLQSTIGDLEQQIIVETIQTPPPKLLVLTVDVEAGSRCGDVDPVSTCMYGKFGNQSAGIGEMMDIADEVGVKMSFFVDVMELYAYGDQLIHVMQDIHTRGHDVQLHFHPALINSSSWEIIQNSTEWKQSGAIKETYMTCWDQNTSDFWFSRAMEIFDEANVPRPIAYRGGAYRYCDTIIEAMAKHNMTQSYNYNIYSSGRQNFSIGYLHNFQWENDIFEFPITYVKDSNGDIVSSSRIDERLWSDWFNVAEVFERYYDNQSSTRVMTAILHSFSFLDKNETGDFYLKDNSKVNGFRSFMHNLSSDYTIVSASELQGYLDNETIQGELKLPLQFLENECHR